MVIGIFYFNVYFDRVCIVFMQGVFGIKVKIMFDWDFKGKMGLQILLLDFVIIYFFKDDDIYVSVFVVVVQEVEIVDSVVVQGRQFLNFCQRFVKLWE